MSLTICKLVFWLHLIAGAVTGLVILQASVTGVLLMYERQLVAWAERGPLQTDPPATPALTPSTLLARAHDQRPGLPPAVTLVFRRDPREPAEIQLGREGSVYLNAYTGEIAGTSHAGLRGFFQQVTGWHRWFATPPGR
jgi:uncharacterized iron-regulated membrane protein